jgi:hypothetical protein
MVQAHDFTPITAEKSPAAAAEFGLFSLYFPCFQGIPP